MLDDNNIHILIYGQYYKRMYTIFLSSRKFGVLAFKLGNNLS